MENKTAEEVLKKLHCFPTNHGTSITKEYAIQSMKEYGNQQWNAALDEVKKSLRKLPSQSGLTLTITIEDIDNLKK